MSKRYLYNHNTIWKIQSNGDHEMIPMTGNEFASRVVPCIDGRGGFEFELAESRPGEKFWCYYPWAFVEDTQENLGKFIHYMEMRSDADKAQKLSYQAWKEVKTLEVKKTDSNAFKESIS